MKYIDNLDETLKQNSVLRFVCIFLSLIVGTVTVLLIFSQEKQPLLIERGCTTKVLSPQSESLSQTEIEAFLRQAIEQRFNSDAVLGNFLSVKQKQLRDDEQTELKSRNFSQFVVYRQAKIKNNESTVDTDRLISVGEVRSAFKFPIKVEFSRTNRTLDNPYGLILIEVHPEKK